MKVLRVMARQGARLVLLSLIAGRIKKIQWFGELHDLNSSKN